MAVLTPLERYHSDFRRENSWSCFKTASKKNSMQYQSIYSKVKMQTDFRRTPFVISKHSNSVHGFAGSSQEEDLNLRRIRHSHPKRKNAFRSIGESPHLFKKKEIQKISTNQKGVCTAAANNRFQTNQIPHQCLFQPNLQIPRVVEVTWKVPR